MKKLVLFALILALIAGSSVFAQDDESNWKVGFMARGITDLVWATKVTEKSETTAASKTTTKEYGEFNKGSFNLFNGKYVPTADNRILLSISNSGENHEVYADIKFDGWTQEGFQGVMDFLERDPADWYLKGTAGIFNAEFSTGGYDGIVSPYATWNDYLGWNTLCRFGVMRSGYGDGSFIASNTINSFDEWGPHFAVGAQFTDAIKLSLGHKLFTKDVPSFNNPAASASSVNFSTLLSVGSIADMIDLDVFYGIQGYDENNARRGTGGEWENVGGVYAGLKFGEIGLSFGYTATLTMYEAGEYWGKPEEVGQHNKATALTKKSPIFSGVDLHLNIGGIDALEDGVTFNNRASFAGAKGDTAQADIKDTVILGLDGTRIYKDQSDSWFAWESEVKTKINFLTVHLANRLSLDTEERKPGNDIKTTKTTFDEFRLSLMAGHNVGAATISAGAFFGISGKTENIEEGSNSSSTKSYTQLQFGIPLVLEVSF